MTERPIIMSAESVRAILDGRKTQTRRVINPQPPDDIEHYHHKDGLWYPVNYPGCRGEMYPVYHGVRCPYGAVGDRLYVRETWKSSFSEYQETGQGHGGPDDPCWGYKATMTYSCGKPIPDYPIAWKSPIYMPKIAARIWLEITGIRAERLQEITVGDVVAEGLPSDIGPPLEFPEPEFQWFIHHWDNLNAKRGHLWDTNSWVWVIECQRT